MASPDYFSDELYYYHKPRGNWSQDSETGDVLCNIRGERSPFLDKVTGLRTTPSETDDSSDADSLWSGSTPSTRMSSPALSGIYPYELFMSSLKDEKREERSVPTTPIDKEPSIETLTWHFGKAALDLKAASALKVTTSPFVAGKNRHVDYLSHDWAETDLWASWRLVSGESTSLFPTNKKRLENASWRAWGKCRLNLQTVSPETLNWLKDCDTTWLYGPLVHARPLVIGETPDPNIQASIPDNSAGSATEGPKKKPILKRKDNLVEIGEADVLLSRSQSAISLPSLNAQNAAQYIEGGHKVFPARPLTVTTNVTDFTHPDRKRPSSMSPGAGSPRREHVHFSYEVEQRIALGDTDEESSDREHTFGHESDSDSDDDLLVMKRDSRRRPPTPPKKERTWTRPLPSTYLKWQHDGEQTLESQGHVQRISPCTSRTLLGSNSFDQLTLLADDEEGFSGDDDDEGINLGSYKNLQTLSPVPRNTSTTYYLTRTINNLEAASSLWGCGDTFNQNKPMPSRETMDVNRKGLSNSFDNICSQFPRMSVNPTAANNTDDTLSKNGPASFTFAETNEEMRSSLDVSEERMRLILPSLKVRRIQSYELAWSKGSGRCDDRRNSQTEGLERQAHKTGSSSALDTTSVQGAVEIADMDDTDGYDTNTESHSDESILTSSSDSIYERLCDRVRESKHEVHLKPALTPLQRSIVNRIMAEFWTIFNQTWTEGQRTHAGRASSESNGTPSSVGSSNNQRLNPRKRRKQEDDPSESGSGRGQGTPSSSNNNPAEAGDPVRFACPFRKHDPHTYNVYSHSVCSISHWTTISRVKEHLYRAHRIPPHCKRCWEQFKSQAALDTHLTVEATAICDLKPGSAPEGISSDQERRLRSRKKSSPNQSDEERWRDIYKILFPDEEIPSPYFEPLPEEVTMSPDSRELAGYEEYIRRELPRLVRSNIEEAVRREMQPLEASLISNLVGIVRDCQDLVFRSYRQSQGLSEEAVRSPSPLHEMLPPPITSGPNSLPHAAQATSSTLGQENLVTNIWRAPSTQSLSSSAAVALHHETPYPQPDTPAMDKESEADSGYASGHFQICGCCGPCLCGHFGEQQQQQQPQQQMFDSTGDVVGEHMEWTDWHEYPSLSSFDFGSGEFGWKTEHE